MPENFKKSKYLQDSNYTVTAIGNLILQNYFKVHLHRARGINLDYLKPTLTMYILINCSHFIYKCVQTRKGMQLIKKIGFSQKFVIKC